MSIPRQLFCLVLSFLFLAASSAVPQANSAHANSIYAPDYVQIAQSDEEKPKEGEEEDDLGEDDC